MKRDASLTKIKKIDLDTALKPFSVDRESNDEIYNNAYAASNNKPYQILSLHGANTFGSAGRLIEGAAETTKSKLSPRLDNRDI